MSALQHHAPPPHLRQVRPERRLRLLRRSRLREVPAALRGQERRRNGTPSLCLPAPSPECGQGAPCLALGCPSPAPLRAGDWGGGRRLVPLPQCSATTPGREAVNGNQGNRPSAAGPAAGLPAGGGKRAEQHAQRFA